MIRQGLPRVHGFQCPWTPHLVSVLLYLAANQAYFTNLTITCLQEIKGGLRDKLILIPITLLNFAFLNILINGFLLIKADPTDQIIHLIQKEKALKQEKRRKLDFFCKVCDSQIQIGTVHCNTCEKIRQSKLAVNHRPYLRTKYY